MATGLQVYKELKARARTVCGEVPFSGPITLKVHPDEASDLGKLTAAELERHCGYCAKAAREISSALFRGQIRVLDPYLGVHLEECDDATRLCSDNARDS